VPAPQIAAAVKASVELQNSTPRQRGRPRLYADRAARDRFYRAQRKQRVEMGVEIPPRDEITPAKTRPGNSATAIGPGAVLGGTKSATKPYWRLPPLTAYVPTICPLSARRLDAEAELDRLRARMVETETENGRLQDALGKAAAALEQARRTPTARLRARRARRRATSCGGFV
jgi:hypothetical protein